MKKSVKKLIWEIDMELLCLKNDVKYHFDEIKQRQRKLKFLLGGKNDNSKTD